MAPFNYREYLPNVVIMIQTLDARVKLQVAMLDDNNYPI